MFSKVAVGTDGSPTAAEAVKAAVEMARRFDAELVLISAFGEDELGGDPDERQWSTNSAALMREVLDRTESDVRRQGIRCSQLIDEGDPAEVLVRLAEEAGADVIVIGNRGMQRRLLGSVPNTVTHKASCSVFVVKTT